MEYILLHKDTMVANVEFGPTGVYEHINGFYKKELMPVGTRVDDRFVDTRFKIWLESRMFPREREHRTRLMNLGNAVSGEQLLMKNYGLSLNDDYWFKKREKIDIKPFWNDINFYKNSFSNFVGDILIKNDSNYDINFLSPDITTPGKITKRWHFEEDGVYLYKGGTKDFDYLDVANEIIASHICNLLNINNANYELVEYNNSLYAKSKCFCDENTEFFSALMLSTEKETTGKHGVLRFIKENGFKKDLDKIIVLDYLMCNIDRDLTNIGFLRNADTLELIGLAPVYDTGYSLWCDYKYHEIGELDEAKPFETTHERQIKMVDSFDWLNLSKLDNVHMFIIETLRKFNIAPDVQKRIADEFNKRLNRLKEIIYERNEEYVEEKKIVTENKKINDMNLTISTKGGFGF